jgi:hypothetical protein
MKIAVILSDKIACHPERVPACRDESKDLRLLLLLRFATFAHIKGLVPHPFAFFLAKGWETSAAQVLLSFTQPSCRIEPICTHPVQ